MGRAYQALIGLFLKTLLDPPLFPQRKSNVFLLRLLHLPLSASTTLHLWPPLLSAFGSDPPDTYCHLLPSSSMLHDPALCFGILHPSLPPPVPTIVTLSARSTPTVTCYPLVLCCHGPLCLQHPPPSPPLSLSDCPYHCDPTSHDDPMLADSMALCLLL